MLLSMLHASVAGLLRWPRPPSRLAAAQVPAELQQAARVCMRVYVSVPLLVAVLCLLYRILQNTKQGACCNSQANKLCGSRTE